MISKLLQVTDAVIGTALPVTTRHIAASLQGGQPVVHAGGGNFVPVANDLTGFWSYQRLRGEVSVTQTRRAGDPCEALQVTVPLRIVALLDRDGCTDDALRLSAALRAARKQLQAATQTFDVQFERIAWAFDPLPSTEFVPMPEVPTQRTMLVMDATIIVLGKASCMTDCAPVDVTCALIAASTLDKIRECLGDRLAELCDIPVGPCDPLTWELRNSDNTLLDSGAVNEPCGAELGIEAPDATVTRDGQPFDTVPSGGAIDVPSDCPDPEPCDPATFSIAGTTVAIEEEPCGAEVDVPCDQLVDGLWVEGLLAPDGGECIHNGFWPVGDVSGLPPLPGRDPNATVYRVGGRVIYRLAEDGQWRMWCQTSDVIGDQQEPYTEAPYNGEDWNQINPEFGTFTVRQATVADICREPCPTLCELIEEVDPEDIGTAVLDCFSEAQEDAAKEILCDPCPVSITLNGGPEIIEVEDPCDTPVQDIEVIARLSAEPVGTIFSPGMVRIGAAIINTTDGLTEVAQVDAEDSFNLPQSVIKYRDQADDPQVTAASNTEFALGGLRPALEIPRREIFDDSPAPLGLYVTADDLINDTVPQVPAATPCDLCTEIGNVAPADVEDDIWDCVAANAQVPLFYVAAKGLCDDPDVMAWATKVMLLDGQALEAGVVEAMCTFVASLKAGGSPLWDKVSDILPLLGARTLAGALVPLKGCPLVQGNAVGSGNYDREGGIVGNGSTRYIRTGIRIDTHGQNDVHFSVYVSSAQTLGASGAYCGGGGTTGPGSLMIARAAGGDIVMRNRNTTSNTIGANTTGFLGHSRTGSANYTARRAGANSTITQASQAPSDLEILVLAQNASVGWPTITDGTHTDGRVCMFTHGTGLSGTELGNLQTAVDTFVADINTAIP